jgi:Cell wall hydrolyses involved in spore germination
MNKFKKATTLFLGILLSVIVLTNGVFAASYTVANNDSLYKIGNLFNTSISTIRQDNSLKSDVIYPGQVLSVSAQTYTVKSGDSLYLIAKKYNVSLQALRLANNKWNDAIHIGQVLLIPGSTTRSTASSSIYYTQSDVNLLARLIMAEAESEPYLAKVAVGAVVVNRVKSGEFANSISAVIYQKINGYYQFTPVENGFINKPASAEAVKAAYEALSGNDPSKGSLFYFDDSATNKWLWSKPIRAWIGKMVFVY